MIARTPPAPSTSTATNVPCGRVENVVPAAPNPTLLVSTVLMPLMSETALSAASMIASEAADS